MRFGSFVCLSLLGCGLLFPGVASAQFSVPFDTLAQGQMSRFGPAEQVVARSQQAFDAAGLAQYLPSTAQIDWSREMVIAVFMGIVAGSLPKSL